MNPVKPSNSKWAEIEEHGLFGRQLEPLLFKQQNRKWVALAGIAILGFTFYWTFTYSGPYRYFAELQLKWFGFYGMKLTAVLVFSSLVFGLLLIAAAIQLLFRGAERPISEMQTAPMASTASPATVAEWLQSWHRPIMYAKALIVYATALLVFGMGAYTYYNGASEGNLQQLSVADFENGKLRARVLYTDVHGHLSKSYISSNDYRYIPMVSEENATGPVKLMVGINDYEIPKYLHQEADGAISVRGVADKALPGDVRYAFNKDRIDVADPVWVLHAGRDPSRDRQIGLMVMGFAVALAGFVFGWQSYCNRKRTKAQAAQATG